jgi:hypothetical protein
LAPTKVPMPAPIAAFRISCSPSSRDRANLQLLVIRHGFVSPLRRFRCLEQSAAQLASRRRRCASLVRPLRHNRISLITPLDMHSGVLNWSVRARLPGGNECSRVSVLPDMGRPSDRAEALGFLLGRREIGVLSSPLQPLTLAGPILEKSVRQYVIHQDLQCWQCLARRQKKVTSAPLQ